MAAANVPTERLTTRDVLTAVLRTRMAAAGLDGRREEVLLPLYLDTTDARSPPVSYVLRMGSTIDNDEQLKALLESVLTRDTITEPQAQRRYLSILEQCFEDNRINWGRIATVMVFTSTVFNRALEAQNPRRAMQVMDWCLQFFQEKHIEDWIQARDGWDDLHRQAEARHRRAMEENLAEMDEVENEWAELVIEPLAHNWIFMIIGMVAHLANVYNTIHRP